MTELLSLQIIIPLVVGLICAAFAAMALPKSPWYRHAQGFFVATGIVADVKIIAWAAMSAHTVSLRLGVFIIAFSVTNALVAGAVLKVQGHIREEEEERAPDQQLWTQTASYDLTAENEVKPEYKLQLPPPTLNASDQDVRTQLAEYMNEGGEILSELISRGTPEPSKTKAEDWEERVKKYLHDRKMKVYALRFSNTMITDICPALVTHRTRGLANRLYTRIKRLEEFIKELPLG